MKLFAVTCCFLMKIALGLTAGSVPDESGGLQASIAFKKEGLYAAGVQRGHLYLPIDLEAPRNALARLMPEIKSLKNLLDGVSPNGTKRAQSVFLKATLEQNLEELDVAYSRLVTLIRQPEVEKTSYSISEHEELLNHLRRIDSGRRTRNVLTRRWKRQVEFVSLGLSLYNFYEIYRLSGQIESQGKDLKFLKQTVEKEMTITNDLVKTVDDYHTIILDLVHKMGDGSFELYRIESYLQLNAHLRKLIDEINLLISGLGDLFQGKLNPHLLNWPKLEEPLTKLHLEAAKKDLKPLFNEWGWVLNSPFSFYIEGTLLRLILHVPYFADNLYPLYRYLDLPFVSKEFKENGISMVIAPEKEYIAVDPKTHVGKTLSKTEFDECSRFQLRDQKVFVCTENSLMETQLDQTCLGTLFMGTFEWEELKIRCNLKLAFPKPFFHLLSPNKVAYFLPKLAEIRLDCQNETRIKIEKKVGMHIQEVPDHCKFSAQGVLFFPETHVDLQSEPWTYFAKEIPFAHLDFDWEKAESALKALSGMHKIGTMDLDEFRQHQWTEDRHLVHGIVDLIVGGLIILVVGIGTFMVWKKVSLNLKNCADKGKKTENIELEERKSEVSSMQYERRKTLEEGYAEIEPLEGSMAGSVRFRE